MVKKKQRGIPIDGEVLKGFMKKYGVTVAQLAEVSGVGRSTIISARASNRNDKASINQISIALQSILKKKKVKVDDLEVEAGLRVANVDMGNTGVERSNMAKPHALDSQHGNIVRGQENLTGVLPKVNGFVGREHIAEVVEQFSRNGDSGHLFIRGEPGIGKSWLMHHLMNELDPVAVYFISCATGRNSSADVIEAIKRQLSTEDDGLLQSAADLDRILELKARRHGDSPMWIMIDALDELAQSELNRPSNPLGLSPSLPDNVRFLLSTRAESRALGQFDTMQIYDIDPSGQENLKDLKAFIERQVVEDGVKSWLKSRKLSNPKFVDQLLEKSGGNFMYTRHVLTSLANGEFSDLNMDTLPSGLQGYYELQWRRMQERAGTRFSDFDQPLMLWFAQQEEPMDATELAEAMGLPVHTVGEVINDWEMYLRRSGSPQRYSLYHKSFSDFLTDKIAPGCRDVGAEILPNLAQRKP